VHGVFPAPGTVFFQFKPVATLSFPRRPVVLPLALATLQCDVFPHGSLCSLLQYLGNNASANRVAALADCKAQLFFHGDGRDKLADDLHVISRQNHIRALRQHN